MPTDRQRLREWLLGILSTHDIAASELARRASLAPSTLTRFLADDDAPLLSTRTTSKIEAAVRNLGAPASGGLLQIPTERVEIDDEDPRLARVINATLADRPQSYAARLGDDHDLAALGYMAGDYLFVDPGEPPVAGQIAAAQVIDWHDGSAHAVYRLFDPPYLISGDLIGHRRKPLIVDNDQVVLRGHVYASLRWLSR